MTNQGQDYHAGDFDEPAGNSSWVPVVLVGCGLLLVVGVVVGGWFFYFNLSADMPDKVKAATARSDLVTLDMAEQMFRTTHGRSPKDIEEMVSPPADPQGGQAVESFLEEVPLDPWTLEPYEMLRDEEGRPYWTSYGADGVEGGEGVEADLSSRDS